MAHNWNDTLSFLATVIVLLIITIPLSQIILKDKNHD